MSPSWSFSRIPPGESANSRATVISPRLAISTTASTIMDSNPSTYAMTYGRLHLLGLPSEVRDEIWQTVFNDILSVTLCTGRDQRPRTSYDSLTYTCHQIHDEISFFWPRTIVQHQRILIFIQPRAPNRHDFKHLTLEIPIDQKYDFFLQAARSLKYLAPVLRDLRLFFVGSDKFHVPLSLEACGLRHPKVSLVSRKLTIDGQNHSIRQPLFIALLYLFNLRSLVLSNHNYPILPKFAIENKKCLKFLHIVTDPRTTIHRMHDLQNGLTPLMIKPLTHSFPPVEVLNICANASLNSLQLAGACTLNLRHLTWTVPDCALQSSGGIPVNWYNATANLFHVLKMNAKQLLTLRMCFHEDIYEGNTAAATLMPAFHHYLEHLPIETLELHLNSKSPWFGREIIECLPNSLRRLYITQELIDEAYLAQVIDSRYMACHRTSTENPWVTTSRFLKQLQGTESLAIVDSGEDVGRLDYISLGGGKLGFIGYQYDGKKSTRFGNSRWRSAKAGETRTWMLILNGRLLDRERNMHLVDGNGGRLISTRKCILAKQPKPQTYSIAEKYGPMWIYVPASVKERESASNELDCSFFSARYNEYFGNEDAAAEVFDGEVGVSPDDVLERLWPDEVSVKDDDHWMTDDKYGRQSSSEDEDGFGFRTNNAFGQLGDDWKSERTAYWVHNWTWYSRTKSYLDENERNDFLSERQGPTLACLTLSAGNEG